jgi:preprotein translocase subunit SecD
MSKTLPWLTASLASCLLRAQVPHCQTIEVSIVAERPNRSARQIRSDEGKRIYLTEKPLLTNNDFTHATVTLTEGQFVLNLDMTSDNAQRVQTFTKNNVGKEMAFVVNRRVIRTPKIRDPILGNGFLIGAFDRDEAQRLADAINRPDGLCNKPSSKR